MALVLHHSRAKGTDKLVLIGIANHDGDGGAWPAIKTLAKYANVSERAVQRSIASLVQMGELEVLENRGGKPETRGDRRPNLYRILIHNGVTHMSPRTDHGVTSATPRGDAHDAHGVTHTSPEPSLEPPMKKNPPSPRERGAVDNPRSCKRHVRPKAYCADCQKPPPAPAPSWCGTCDPQGEHDVGARMIAVVDDEGTERWGACPRCHPAALRRTA